MRFQAAVMNVSDLGKSLDFYRDVFGFVELSRRDQLAAMYAPGNEYPQVIVLRELGGSNRVGGARHAGLRALVLEVDSSEELDRIAAALESQGRLVGRPHGDTWAAVFGRDLDQTAIVAGASLTSDTLTLEAWANLDPSLYGVGE